MLFEMYKWGMNFYLLIYNVNVFLVFVPYKPGCVDYYVYIRYLLLFSTERKSR